MQDFFAHQVLVKAIKSKNDYFGKKGAKLEEKYSKRAFYKMNEIIYSDNVQYGRDHFEDDPKVFWWRNCYAKTVTEQAYKLWHMNKRINILRTEQKENNLIYKHKILHNGSYWTVKARQFFLVVNSNWFLGYMKF